MADDTPVGALIQMMFTHIQKHFALIQINFTHGLASSTWP
jgi:hypothetical protein